MSARGRRAHRPQPSGPPEFAWILLVLAAALIGGLAAVPLVHASLIIAVVVSVIAAAIAVLALRMSPALPRGQATYGPSPVSPPPGAPVHGNPPPGAPVHANPPPGAPVSGVSVPEVPIPGSPVPTGAVPDGSGPGQAGYDRQAAPWPPSPAETVVQMLPLPHQPGEETRAADAPWWDPAPGTAPQPSQGAKRAPAPDLTTYLASTFIAQCPRCGAFRLDIRQAKNAWDFRCEACEYTWAWRPGTAWPPVRVMPGRRRELHPPAS
ncbi:MAG: hypothetical protein WAK82_41675 [Streptosporangiaceae bacterium]